MDTTWIVPIALVFGFALGAFVVQAVGVAAARGRRAMSLASEPIPDGVTDVVQALESVGVVLDASNTVLQASPGAAGLGLVLDRALATPELVELVNDVRRSGEPTSRDVEVRRGSFAGGAVLQLHARAAPLGNRFILLLADDHTEQVRLEGVRRDFVANVSHELKTPIGAISLLADAIDAAADDTERVRAFASRMQAESDRLARMTKEIIDLSRIQADDPLSHPSRVAIGDVVDAAVEANRVAADAKRIRLTTRVLDRVDVLGDAALLTMAMQNLVANAVQYSPDATHVGIGARRTGDTIDITVTDQGPGIGEEDQLRVFERFYRVDPARSRITGGTGLGLSIVKHVAQGHGGEVVLWSKIGQGSTFTLRLPIAQAQQQKESA